MKLQLIEKIELNEFKGLQDIKQSLMDKSTRVETLKNLTSQIGDQINNAGYLYKAESDHAFFILPPNKYIASLNFSFNDKNTQVTISYKDALDKEVLNVTYDLKEDDKGAINITLTDDIVSNLQNRVLITTDRVVNEKVTNESLNINEANIFTAISDKIGAAIGKKLSNSKENKDIKEAKKILIDCIQKVLNYLSSSLSLIPSKIEEVDNKNFKVTFTGKNNCICAVNLSANGENIIVEKLLDYTNSTNPRFSLASFLSKIGKLLNIDFRIDDAALNKISKEGDNTSSIQKPKVSADAFINNTASSISDKVIRDSVLNIFKESLNEASEYEGIISNIKKKDEETFFDIITKANEEDGVKILKIWFSKEFGSSIAKNIEEVFYKNLLKFLKEPRNQTLDLDKNIKLNLILGYLYEHNKINDRILKVLDNFYESELKNYFENEAVKKFWKADKDYIYNELPENSEAKIRRLAGDEVQREAHAKIDLSDPDATIQSIRELIKKGNYIGFTDLLKKLKPSEKDLNQIFDVIEPLIKPNTQVTQPKP